MKPSTYQISHKINHFVNQTKSLKYIIAAPFNRTTLIANRSFSRCVTLNFLLANDWKQLSLKWRWYQMWLFLIYPFSLWWETENILKVSTFYVKLTLYIFCASILYTFLYKKNFFWMKMIREKLCSYKIGTSMRGITGISLALLHLNIFNRNWFILHYILPLYFNWILDGIFT